MDGSIASEKLLLSVWWRVWKSLYLRVGGGRGRRERGGRGGGEGGRGGGREEEGGRKKGLNLQPISSYNLAVIDRIL